MAKAAQAVKKFKSWNGLKEGTAVDKAIIDPWNDSTGCHATSKKNPWCAIAYASCLIQVHGSGYSKSSTCKNQKAYYKKNGRWHEAGERPHLGDCIFITGHEGMVISTSPNGAAKYISGNSMNMVRISSFNWKKKKAGTKKIVGYGRPIWKA